MWPLQGVLNNVGIFCILFDYDGNKNCFQNILIFIVKNSNHEQKCNRKCGSEFRDSGDSLITKTKMNN
jgi:hypothetical protein